MKFNQEQTKEVRSETQLKNSETKASPITESGFNPRHRASVAFLCQEDQNEKSSINHKKKHTKFRFVSFWKFL